MWEIAIIDDDPNVLNGLQRSIPWEALNARCTGTAQDGQQGLELIRKNCPDIIMTDIYMPVMNGLDMLEQLQEEKFEAKIIILSGYKDFEYALKAIRLNVLDYLSKPARLQTIHDVLSKAIHKIEEERRDQNEYDRLLNKLRLYEPFVAQETVQSIVTGTFDEKARIEQFINSHSEDWTTGRHAVMGIDIIKNYRLQEITISDWNLFRFAVMNIIQEVVEQSWSNANIVQLHSNHIAVLLHEHATESAEALLTAVDLARQLVEKIDQYLHIKIRIGLGRWKTRWTDIPKSTEEAFFALSFPHAANEITGNVMEYIGGNENRCSNEDGLAAIKPVQFYQEITQAICHLQEEKAIGIIERFQNELENKNHITPSYLKVLAQEIWTVLTYSLFDLGIDLGEISHPSIMRQELEMIHTPSHLSEWAISKIQLILQDPRWNENQKHKQAVQFLIDYIYDHYDEEITLSDLAKQVYISRNYMSQIFKKATGETFNQFLTKVRMEKAKRLILEGKLLIYEVAEKVGYKNVPYFSSLFKKHTGFNPTDLS